MDRRGFIKALASGLAVASVDPERLLWTPGKKTIFIPQIQVIPLRSLVANINYSIFDVQCTDTGAQFAYLEAHDLSKAMDHLLKMHDVVMFQPDTIMIPPQLEKLAEKVLHPPTLLERLLGRG